jgi:hypothetical protein
LTIEIAERTESNAALAAAKPCAMVDGSGISQSFFKYVRVSTRFTTCRAAAAEDRCDAGKMAEEILYWRRRVKRLAEAVGRSSARSHSFLWASGRTGSQVSASRAGGVKPGRREIAGEISVRLCHTAPACRDDAHACGGFAMFDSYDELAAAHRENCRERRAAEAALQSEAAELPLPQGCCRPGSQNAHARAK